MKWIKYIGISLIVLYVIVCLGLYFIQEKILFNPSKLPDTYAFRAGEEIEIPVSDNISLNCLWLKRGNKSKKVILYLHGNRGSNRRCLNQALSAFGETGYDIFMPDYRGYGKTEGKIYSEKQMHNDIAEVYSFLKKEYEEKNIVIAGYSLGSGMATRVAAENNPAQLFLMAPYYSIIDMKNKFARIIPNFLVKYKLKNNKNIPKVKCPITIFHGTEDEVIPYDSSIRLMELDPTNIELVKLEGTHHRRTIFHHEVKRKILEAIR